MKFKKVICIGNTSWLLLCMLGSSMGAGDVTEWMSLNQYYANEPTFHVSSTN